MVVLDLRPVSIRQDLRKEFDKASLLRDIHFGPVNRQDPPAHFVVVDTFACDRVLDDDNRLLVGCQRSLAGGQKQENGYRGEYALDADNCWYIL